MLGDQLDAFAINVTLNKNLPYDPAQGFRADRAHLERAVHAAGQSVAAGQDRSRDWIKLREGAAEPPSYGSAGPGSPQHLSMELLKTHDRDQMVHVPYRGDAPALNDLVAGHIPTHVREPTPALPLIQAGKVRALGVSSPTRLGAGAPTIPTLAEAGVPGLRLRRPGR